MKSKFILSFFAVAVVAFSCKRANESYTKEVLKEWYVPFSATFSNPAVAGRADSGLAHILLLGDNSLRYDYKIGNLLSGDEMTGVTLNAGNPITNGPVLLDLKPRIAPTYTTGGVFNLSQTLVDSLLNNQEIYINVTSKQQPAGLFRGQLNTTVTLAGNISLTGAQEVPPVTTTATGVAVIRVTSDRKVYSRITVSNVETNDQLTVAHIHTGARGQLGPVLVPLVNSPAEFGVPKVTTVTDSVYNVLMTKPLYVNAHSTRNPDGKIRGQLKE